MNSIKIEMPEWVQAIAKVKGYEKVRFLATYSSLESGDVDITWQLLTDKGWEEIKNPKVVISL